MVEPSKESNQTSLSKPTRINSSILSQNNISLKPKIDPILIEARLIVKKLSNKKLLQAELCDIANDNSSQTIFKVIDLINNTLITQKAARSDSTYHNLFELNNFIRSTELKNKLSNLLAGELFNILSSGKYLFDKIDRQIYNYEKLEEDANKVISIFSSKFSSIYTSFNKIVNTEITSHSKNLNRFFNNILNFSDKIKNRCPLSYKNTLDNIVVWAENAENQRCSGRALINLVHYHYDRNEDDLAVWNLKHAIEVMNSLEQRDRKLLICELDNLLYSQSSNINFQRFYEVLQSLWSEFGCDQEVLESKLSFINTLLEAHEELNEDNVWGIVTKNIDIASRFCEEILISLVQEKNRNQNLDLYKIKVEITKLRVDAFYLPTLLDATQLATRIFDKYKALEEKLLNSQDLGWQTELFELRESCRDFLFSISRKSYFSYEMRRKLKKLYEQVGCNDLSIED